MNEEQLLTHITANWSVTDEIVYETPEVKLRSLKAAETRVYSRDKIAAFVDAQRKPEPAVTVAEMNKEMNRKK